MNRFSNTRSRTKRPAVTPALTLAVVAPILFGGAAPALPARAAVGAVGAAVAAPTEPASASRLTGIRLPGGAERLTDPAMAGEFTALLKTMADAENFALGETEALVWRGGKPSEPSGPSESSESGAVGGKARQDAIAQSLRTAGYNFQTVADRDIPDGRATVFMAGKTGTGRAALGLFVTRKDLFLVTWGWITRKSTAAAPAAGNETAPAASPAELVGGTWSWTTISSVGYRDPVTRLLAEPSGMSARFTFLPGGRYKYFWYTRLRTYSLVTEATSTHEGTVTFDNDGGFTLHPSKGHYKGSTGSRIIDRPMTDAERKPTRFVYEWRREDGERRLYIGPSKASLSRFKRAE